MPSLRTLYRTLGRDVKASYLFFKTHSYVKKCHRYDRTLIDNFRSTAQKNRHRTCFIFQDEKWTYQMVDEFSNKVANCFISLGYSKGDEVALLLDNCPEYPCIWLGLAKIGVVTALINTNLKRDSLGHSVSCIDSKAIIFGRNYSETVKEATSFFNNKDSMEYFCFTEKGASTDEIISFPGKSLNALLEEASPSPIDPKKHKIHFNDKLIYIYTSGTTGLPKAAIIRHSRSLWISAAAKFIPQLTDDDVIYNPLPMYHTAGGILFVTVVLMFGGKMIIRKKFSASNYWKDAVKYKVTIAQYIGEMCRYLLNQPVREEEKQHCIRRMFGNGLRPHIWKEFQERFGIYHIIEIYGATEGNANLVNMFGKIGAVGFLPRICERLYPVSLVKVDPETREIVRNEKGLCIRCKPGEPGEMVGKIISNPINSFDGYANQNETKKKIVRNCFEKGDVAFLSGDILIMDEDGYLYFLDRAGDTFRWRGENVSTGEVENTVSRALGHVSCVVYGVEIPNAEGRAGMAAIQVDPKSVNFSEFYQNLSKRLPPYAVPLFLRLSKEIEETGTYKLKKVTYQKEGFNPEEIHDSLFFLDAKQKTYIPLTKELYSDIMTGKLRL
ncbi:long-chain fatty acid transport protein 4-like [Argiope bruennichi]|uniref:long-chain fatty acid transport protein 4-like n=1 Tax=Argiope bruennichi TaxID=94029 RepID=UPI002494D0A6|nr:long-chain fatty acid transport protein 4-like [Argiope bruennichi]